MHNVCNFLPSEESAKHSSFDELSAKVKVLEAENESLKAFIQESSSKETEARKELSEKHARDLAELNEKLERSQGRVISTVAKNKVLEAEAEAIDKLIFRKRFFRVVAPRILYAFSLTELNLLLSQQALALSGQKSQT
jgi:predicted nuclease with TOPRIM domain